MPEQQRYIQSYFYVFRENVVKSGVIGRFLEKVKKERSFRDVVRQYELGFSAFLEKQGFNFDVVVKGVDLASFPLEALQKGAPFIKNKYLEQEIKELFAYFKANNMDTALLK